MRFRVATSNIRDNPDISRWRVRFAAAGTGQLCDVAFFQEIGELQDHEDIEAAMGPMWDWVGRDIAIPIAYKRRQWRLVSSGHELMHHGRARTSPDRYVNWVVLQRRRRFRRFPRFRRQPLICFMNTHFISGAWNNKDKLNKSWRQMEWITHYTKMAARVEQFTNSGVTVILGGDFNRLNVNKFMFAQQWLAQHGIDKLAAIPVGCRVQLVKNGSRDLTRVHDHRAVWAEIVVK